MTPVLPTAEQLISFCNETRSSSGGQIVRISDEAVVKFGIDVTPAEAATQLYAWKYTNPTICRVPELYWFSQDESQGPTLAIGYLVMEFIEGTALSTYLDCATSTERRVVVKCIIDVIRYLETIPQPDRQGPGPVGGGSLRGYLWSDSGVHLSFVSPHEMGSWMNQILLEYGTGSESDLFEFAAAKLVMCHTDLAPRNVLRLSDGRIALLDWGSAGFFPKIFEVNALRTRVNREHIFAEILSGLSQVDERQIRLLSKIELILLRYGDVINLRFAYNGNTKASLNEKSTPPPLPLSTEL